MLAKERWYMFQSFLNQNTGMDLDCEHLLLYGCVIVIL